MKLSPSRIIFQFVIITIINLTLVHAQEESESKSSSSIFKVKTSYLSNSVYNGRKDSLEVPYLNFSLKYFNSGGFYAGAGISYLVSSYAQRIDAFNINAGYFKAINDNFDFSVNLSKSIYNSNSVSVISEILGNVSGNVTYTNKFFDISAGAYVMVTPTNPDFNFNLSASHTFNLDPEEQWSIEPAVDVNFGSRHYYGSYISERQRKKGKGSSSGGSGGTGGGGTGGGGTGGGGTGGGGTGSGNPVIDIEKTVVALGTDQLKLLDYEISVPLYYRGKKWGFFFIPTYAIPQSPITYETTVKTTITANGNSVSTTKVLPQAVESLSNVFYGEIGVTYKF